MNTEFIDFFPEMKTSDPSNCDVINQEEVKGIKKNFHPIERPPTVNHLGNIGYLNMNEENANHRASLEGYTECIRKVFVLTSEFNGWITFFK